MENVYYDQKFVKALRAYLRDKFTEVDSSYRYRDHSARRGKAASKTRGIVLTARGELGLMRFEAWGGSNLVEVTFTFGKIETRKIFSSFIEIGSGNFGEILEKEFEFINRVLGKVSTVGNNALDFISEYD